MTIRIAIAALAASFVMVEPAFADTSAYMSTGADTFGKIDLNTGVYANIGDTSHLGTPIPLSGLGAYGGASTAAERVYSGFTRSTRAPAR
jgi:hypothetical protein